MLQSFSSPLLYRYAYRYYFRRRVHGLHCPYGSSVGDIVQLVKNVIIRRTGELKPDSVIKDFLITAAIKQTGFEIFQG